ncbi:MAG: metalloregulator ArsR/SmtB family transcription factor [Deltaproteobacteria bacterium]
MPRSAADESVFHAIASPTLRALLDALMSGEQSVTDLVAAVDVTQSAVSQQLAVLKGAGVVEERAAGRFRHYRLIPGALVEVDVWIARYRLVMERQLDALGRVLDEMPADAEGPRGRRPGRPLRRRGRR